MSRGGFRFGSRFALLLALLGASPLLAFDLVPNVGFPGQTLNGVRVTTRPLPASGATVTFFPAGLTPTNLRNDSGGFLLFDLTIASNAAPGNYAGIYFQSSEGTVSNPNAFTVIAQPPTPLPSATPTPTPPSPTPTQTPTPTPPLSPTPTPPFPGPTPVPGGLQIAPDTIAEGTRFVRLIIAGTSFGPTTTVQTPSDIRLDRSNVLSPTRLEIFVSNAVGTPSGPRVFFVSTPGVSSGSVVVTVIPANSLGAPVSVTTSAIVFPRPGAFVSPGDQLFARGLLAVTGSGPILGSWNMDGAPYERFNVYASGGQPVPVESKVPIPILTDGDHFLQIQIDQPQAALSEPVLILRVPRGASQIRLVEPADGVVASEPRPFRWTLVPGAQAYEIVFSPEAAQWEPNVEYEIKLSPDVAKGPASRIFRSVQGLWEPTREEWGWIGAGTKFWAVRPIFPVDVRGPLTPWRRVAITPVTASLALLTPSLEREKGLALLSWKGGSPGLLYRVLFFRGDSREPVFSALTFRPQYPLRRFLLGDEPERLHYQVEAIAPGGVRVGRSAFGQVELPRSQGRIWTAALAAEVTSRNPPDGSQVQTTRPTIGARWSGQVALTEISLVVDNVDVTGAAVLGAGSIDYVPPLPLSPGVHTVRLKLGPSVTTWQFQVSPPSPPAAPGGAGPGRAAAGADWRLELSGFVSVISGNAPNERDTAHLTVSSASSFVGSAWSLQETVDLAGHQELNEPRQTVQDSRNWVVRAGVGRGQWRADALVGYSLPGAADGLQLMTPGFSRGGAEVQLTTPLGKIGGFGTFDDRLPGLFSSTLGGKQRVRMGTYELPLPADRFVLRGVYMEVDDRGEPSRAVTRSTGKMYGGFGRWILSPALALTFEGSHAKYEPVVGVNLDGNAYRLNLQGRSGATGYTLNLYQTDAGFVNPADRALTFAGQPDRRGAEVGLLHLFGRVTTTLYYRYIEGGITSGAVLPRAHAHAAALAIGVPVSSKVLATVSGIWGLDKGDGGAGATGPLPRLDRVQYGGLFTLSETIGKLSLTQNASWVKFDDRLSSLNNRETKTANMTASGFLFPTLALASSFGFNRSEGKLSGQDDNLVLFFQPTWAIPAIRVQLAPRASYFRGENSISKFVTSGEQYQALLYWSPLRVGRFETMIGLSSEWLRNRTSSPGGSSSASDRRYIGTFAIRWGAGAAASNAPMPAAAATPQLAPPPPGALASLFSPDVRGRSPGF